MQEWCSLSQLPGAQSCLLRANHETPDLGNKAPICRSSSGPCFSPLTHASYRFHLYVVISVNEIEETPQRCSKMLSSEIFLINPPPLHDADFKPYVFCWELHLTTRVIRTSNQ